VVYKEGDSSDAIYLVRKGEVEITKIGKNIFLNNCLLKHFGLSFKGNMNGQQKA